MIIIIIIIITIIIIVLNSIDINNNNPVIFVRKCLIILFQLNIRLYLWIYVMFIEKIKTVHNN